MSLVWGKQQPSEIRTREAGGEAFRKIMEGRPGPRTIRVVIRPQEQGVEGGARGQKKKVCLCILRAGLREASPEKGINVE